MKIISIKTKDDKAQKALDTARKHYSELAENWPKLTVKQRREVLEKSPILRGFVELFGAFREVK